MRQLQSFVIFAVNNWASEEGLRQEGLAEAFGVYKGTGEVSFIAPLAMVDEALSIARNHHQESALIVENGACFLRFLSGGPDHYIGQWTWYRDMVPPGDGYTYVKGLGYFAAS